MAGVKTALCGGMILAGESRLFGAKDAKASYAWTAANAALTARFLAVSFQNQQAAALLQKRAKPSYLLAPGKPEPAAPPSRQ